MSTDFEYLYTQRFEPIIDEAQKINEITSNIKDTASLAKTMALNEWKGISADKFSYIYCILNQQLEDITNEFDDIVKALILALQKYVEADNKAAQFRISDYLEKNK